MARRAQQSCPHCCANPSNFTRRRSWSRIPFVIIFCPYFYTYSHLVQCITRASFTVISSQLTFSGRKIDARSRLLISVFPISPMRNV